MKLNTCLGSKPRCGVVGLKPDRLLAGQGWKQTAAVGTTRALEFSRDNSSIAISIMPTSAGTTIALTLSR